MSPKKRSSRDRSTRDPFGGARRDGLADPKLRRLCGQIARTLNIAFGGTCNDELLADLVVESVEPDPDSTRVKVTVCLMETRERIDPEMVLQHLDRAKGFLRSEIAATVDRHSVPHLVFALKRPG
jgi:ribosome-binding factor A